MSYNEELQNNQNIKLREMLEELPEFCDEFFMGIENTTSLRTRIAYCYDLKLFFDYLDKESIKCRVAEDLNNLSLTDLEKYVNYLNYFTSIDDSGKEVIHQNNEKGKSRKIASLRTFFKYFYKKEKLESNVASLLDMPKLHQKEITRLEPDEVAKLLDFIESGESLTKSEKRFFEKTKKRDLALVSLLLGTGIRLSECVGIDKDDIDFDINGIKITRKGGYESIIYFGDEVKDVLINYLNERNIPEGSNAPLFISLQGTRITPRAVQNLVKKYSKAVTPLKNISPHKLRSTYGTSLYRETGDIYLVADVLGHKDVNTTRKHYAKIDDDRRKMAAKVVKLKED